MEILIVSQCFWPENFKINDLSTELVKLGHKVTVITGKPNYPQGKFYKGYSFFTKSKEQFNGVKIIRVPIIPRGNGSSLKLSLNYLSFAFFGSIFTLFHIKKYDFSFVYGVSPITAALPAIIHRIFYKTKMVLWVLDLWPESIEVTGKMNSVLLRKLLNSLVKYIYKQSDKILISSKFMEKSILEKLNFKYNKNIGYLPNWAEDTFLEKRIDSNKYLNLMPNGFKIMFAGNISYGQDFPSIIKAAQLLKNNNIKFIIIGDGSEKEYLLRKIEELDLSETIYYIGSYPVDEMMNFYCHADMMLLSLRDELIYSNTVPGKLQGYLASKKSVVAMINGEAAEIIKRSNCGLVVNAEDYKAFAEGVLKLSKEPITYINELGCNGFSYYQKIFKKEIVIKSLLEFINNL